MRSPDGEFEEGVCPLTMAKEQAMKKVLKRLLNGIGFRV